MEMVIKYEALVFNKEDDSVILSELRETEEDAQRLVDETLEELSDGETSSVKGRVVKKHIMGD